MPLQEKLKPCRHLDPVDTFAIISRLRLQADIQDEQDQEKVFLVIIIIVSTDIKAKKENRNFAVKDYLVPDKSTPGFCSQGKFFQTCYLMSF